eukprot:7574048-Pyramimonas_sp.AAC.1
MRHYGASVNSAQCKRLQGIDSFIVCAMAPIDEGEELYAKILSRSRLENCSSSLSDDSDGSPCSEEDCSLEDLPDALLARVMSHLPGRVLARMCVQNRRLRSIADEPRFWRRACLTHWPESRPEIYNGDWKDLYRQRYGLSPTFISLIDRIYGLHQLKAPDNTYEVLEQVMQCLFSVGLLCAKAPALKQHVESLALCEDLKCWVRSETDGGSAPEHMALRSYLRATRAYLNEYDFWTGRFIHWPNVPWRRSSIAYFFEMVRDTHSEDVDLAEMHYDDCKELDDAISSAAEEADLTVAPPLGMHSSHWWLCEQPRLPAADRASVSRQIFATSALGFPGGEK